MKYKLLASDLDGTLLTEGRYVSKENIAIIKKLHNKEIHFTIATGRNYTNVVNIAKSVGISIPVITNDGALIINLNTKEIIFEKKIDVEIAKGIIEIFDKYDVGYSAHLFEGTYLNKKFKPSKNITKKFLKLNKNIFKIIFNLYKELGSINVSNTETILKKIINNNDLPYKFSIFPHPKETVEKIRDELVEKYGDVLNVIISHESSMEIGLKGISKATGLKILEDYLNVSKKEVMVFGDNYNDVEMMKYAGFGVVMQNAPDDLKKLGDFITDTNEKHGVGKAIEKLVLTPLAKKI